MVQAQTLLYMLKVRDDYFIKNFDSSFFSDYVAEYNYINDYYRKYSTLPSETDFFVQFDDFDNLPVSYSRQALIDELIADKQKRRIIESYQLVNKVFMSNKPVPEQMQEVYAEFEKVVHDFDAGTPKKSVSNFEHLLLDMFQERKTNFNKHFYNTGINWINSICHGWDKDSDYVSVAGRPGTGKSMLLCRFAAEQLKQGKVVEYYSGEMPTIQVVERIVSALTGISATAIFKADPTIEKDYYKFVQNDLPLYKLHIITPQELGGKYATASQLESFAVQDKADILFIDQQSLMEDETKAKIAYERAANISRQIKAMRDRLNIPVITAVQLNRTKLDNNESDTVQIAGSDVIAQDSTKVILIKEKTRGSGEIELNIVKNRNGRSYQTHDFTTHYETCEFVDTEEVEKTVENGFIAPPPTDGEGIMFT